MYRIGSMNGDARWGRRVDLGLFVLSGALTLMRLRLRGCDSFNSFDYLA